MKTAPCRACRIEWATSGLPVKVTFCPDHAPWVQPDYNVADKELHSMKNEP